MEATQTRPSRDDLVDYQPEFGIGGRSRIRVFDELGVIVATELDDNDGMSITNCVEDVATQVERQFDVRLFGTNWRFIEHYPAGRRGSDLPETLFLVVFHGYETSGRLAKPEWLSLPGPMTEWLPTALR